MENRIQAEAKQACRTIGLRLQTEDCNPYVLPLSIVTEAVAMGFAHQGVIALLY